MCLSMYIPDLASSIFKDQKPLNSHEPFFWYLQSECLTNAKKFGHMADSQFYLRKSSGSVQISIQFQQGKLTRNKPLLNIIYHIKSNQFLYKQFSWLYAHLV